VMPCVATHKVMRRRAGLLHGPQPRDCERGFDSGPWARAWERSKSLWVANKKGLPSEIGTTTTLRRAPPPPSHDLPYAMTYGVRHDTYRRIPRRAVRWRAPWRGLRGAHRVRCAAPRHTARDATPTATQRARRGASDRDFAFSTACSRDVLMLIGSAGRGISLHGAPRCGHWRSCPLAR